MNRNTFLPLVRLCCLPFLVLALVLSIISAALLAASRLASAVSDFFSDFVDEVARLCPPAPARQILQPGQRRRGLGCGTILRKIEPADRMSFRSASKWMQTEPTSPPSSW